MQILQFDWMSYRATWPSSRIQGKGEGREMGGGESKPAYSFVLIAMPGYGDEINTDRAANQPVAKNGIIPI